MAKCCSACSHHSHKGHNLCAAAGENSHKVAGRAHSHEASAGENSHKAARIAVSGFLLIVCIWAEHTFKFGPLSALFIFLIPYFIAGYDVLKEALEGIAAKNPLDENFLMAIASLGALSIGFLPHGAPQFAEAVFVMLFYQVGELAEGIGERKAQVSIAELMDIRPDTAFIEKNGKLSSVHPDEVAPGDIIVVKPGEKIALDGYVIEGESSVDMLALTGESAPSDLHTGDYALSGAVNLSGLIKIKVEKRFSDSTVSQILDLIEHAADHKASSERFIRRFAKVYTPVVVSLAVVLAVGVPLLSGDFLGSFSLWLFRALSFLIVSCPCALVISVPLSFFGGIGAASRHGILVKGANHLETLSKLSTLVFDKTGTLTRGVFRVMAVHDISCVKSGSYASGRAYSGLDSCDDDERRLLHLAAHVERYSTHPIAEALRAAYPYEADSCCVSDAKEIAGKGVIARVNDQEVAVGNEALMQHLEVEFQKCVHTGTVIHVAINKSYAGHIVIADEIKPQAKRVLSRLKQRGIDFIVMLSGDKKEVAQSVARQLEIDEYHAELLPQDKVMAVEKLLKKRVDSGGKLGFVGDGINDAPVLARSDVGFAMGALGSDAAIEAADVVLMDDELTKIERAIDIAKASCKVAWQNIIFALAVKVLILGLATVGAAPLWLAILGDVGVLVICIFNALRTLRL